MIIGNLQPDRLIIELYVWVAVDPKTQLEGICGIDVYGAPMQAVTSSRTIAEKLRPLVAEATGRCGKSYKLLRFNRPETIAVGGDI